MLSRASEEGDGWLARALNEGVTRVTVEDRTGHQMWWGGHGLASALKVVVIEGEGVSE